MSITPYTKGPYHLGKALSEVRNEDGGALPFRIHNEKHVTLGYVYEESDGRFLAQAANYHHPMIKGLEKAISTLRDAYGDVGVADHLDRLVMQAKGEI